MKLQLEFKIPAFAFYVGGLISAFELGEEMASYVTSKFPSPVLLEFEKVMWPFVQKAKKRYACVAYEEGPSNFHRDAKGLELVRRDNSESLRDLYKEVWEALTPKIQLKMQKRGS